MREDLSHHNNSEHFQLQLNCYRKAAEGRTTGIGRRLLRGHRILLRRQVDTETEHEHFMHRVEGGRVWLGCGKRLLDSGVPLPLAARAFSLAASSGLQLVIFSFKFTSHTKMLRRIRFQTYSLLKVWESLIYAV